MQIFQSTLELFHRSASLTLSRALMTSKFSKWIARKFSRSGLQYVPSWEENSGNLGHRDQAKIWNSSRRDYASCGIYFRGVPRYDEATVRDGKSPRIRR